MPVLMLQTAQTTTDECFPVPSSRSFYIQIALPGGRQHKEGTFSQSPAPGAHSPSVMNSFPHPMSAQWTGSSLDPGWAGTGQDLQGWQGAGASCAECRDVTKTRMGRSCRARSPWGYFHPQFAFCLALTCRFCLGPTVPGLCTGPGREELGLSGCSGDSPGAATPMGAAVLGVKAPTGVEELTACSKDVLGVLVWCLPTPVTARNCRGGAWGDVLAGPSWCPTWLAECGQGAGREWEGNRGPGCVLTVTPHRVAPLLPSHCFPGGTDRNQGQFFSLSISRVTSVTARAGSADPAGMAVPGNLPTRETWTQRKSTVSRGSEGCTAPAPHRSPLSSVFGGP